MSTAVQDQTLQQTSLPPGRPRRLGIAVVVAIVAALAVAGLSVAALRDDATTVRSVTVGDDPATATPTTAAPVTPPPTTAAPVTSIPTSPPPTTAAPERLTADSRLRLDGLGPVRVGMTLTEASAAAGVPIRLRPEESGGLDCTYARPVDGPEDVAFMVVGGRIVRIDVGFSGTSRVRTLSGVGEGSTEADVMKTYPGQIRVERHHYVEGAHDLVYVPGDPAFSRYSMIFEAIDGKVASFRSGLAEQVAWIEGCS